ncbi:MAG: response regulator [Anaerolineae bacterium]|nr:response regulator [Anaerolineae bacterium]
MPEPLILVVDDDASILETVTAILAIEGYAVATATNGREALEKVGQARPWLVLLDMRMPIMDGWGFAREMKARGETIPIVVMTAAQDARRWASEIGAAAYVPKPFEVPDLLDTVERLQQG